MANRRRDDSGFTLIELLVASSVGVTVLFIVVLLVTVLLGQASSDSAQFSNQQAAISTLGGVAQSLGNARPLGYCSDDITGNPPVPYESCQHVTTTGGALEALSPTGVCFYSYPISADPTSGSTAVVTPPDLQCLFLNGTQLISNVYAYDTNNGATYTTCSMTQDGTQSGTSCWSPGAPAGGTSADDSGAVPTGDCSSTQTNCTTTYIGNINDPTSFFSFYGDNGVAITCTTASCPAASELTSIEAVEFNGAVQAPSVKGTQDYQVYYLTPLRGSQYQQERGWNGL